MKAGLDRLVVGMQLDLGDQGVGRAVPAGLEHVVDLGVFALKHGFHRAVAAGRPPRGARSLGAFSRVE